MNILLHPKNQNGFLTSEEADILWKTPIGDYCTWIPECKDKAVGRGRFADLENSHFSVHDLCERHANRQIEPANKIIVPRPWGYE